MSEVSTVFRNISFSEKVMGLGLFEWYLIVSLTGLGTLLLKKITGDIPILMILLCDLIVYVVLRYLQANKPKRFYLSLARYFLLKRGRIIKS